jgi:hypothetical protein
VTRLTGLSFLIVSALAFAGLSSMQPGRAEATIVKPLSVADMAKRADLVVHGTVLRQTASWNPEHTRIYTVTEIQVTEALKGVAAPGSIVPVRQLGGVADGIVQSIAGNARFTPAEELVVFLDKDETLPWHYVIGMAQGKFSVTPGGTPSVAQDLSDLAFIRPDAAGAAQAVGPAATPAGPAPLEAFKARVRAALAAP